MTGRTPNVFVIGAGPVAGGLAGALRQAGVPVLGLWGRRPELARKAAAAAGVAAFSAAPPDLLLEADCVLVAVRDDAISQVAEMLAGTGLITRNHVLVHCSGSLSAGEAFARLEGRIGGAGTLHPLRSIVDAREATSSLRGTVFGVEGDEPGRAMARLLCKLLGGRPLDLDGQEMAVYHAAASMASNHLVAVIDAAVEALGAAGVEPDEALRAVLSLAGGTLDNLRKVGLPGALTGPIARGDAATVERHQRALADAAPGLLPLYRTLAARAAAVSRKKGEAAADGLAAIERSLASGPRPA